MAQITPELCEKFVKLADEKNLELNEYVATYSQDMVFRTVKKAHDLTVDEAQAWIERCAKAA